MKLDAIKQELESQGYQAYILEDILIAGEYDSFDEELQLKLLRNTFGIEIRDKLFVLEYAKGQTSVEKKFSTEEDLIIFIKQKFTLSK